MQASLPTHSQHAPMPPADERLTLGPICASIRVATGAAVSAVVATACTTLGNTILKAAGKEVAAMPSYANLLVPTLIGTSIVFGGLGFLAGCFSPDKRTC
jgi:ABC-type spermidine/putrescine transport system permease subunit II